jgi:hypothetical protein
MKQYNIDVWIFPHQRTQISGVVKYFCGAVIIASFLNPPWNVVSFCGILLFLIVNITRSCPTFYCDLYRYPISSSIKKESENKILQLTPTTYAL